MTYLEFLGQWYNWPYLTALATAGLATLRPAWFSAVGSRLGTAIGAGGAPGQFVVQVFGLTLGVIGLTVTGAVHDYWPGAQGRAFAAGLIGVVLLAVLIARGLGRVRARHFPEMKAVRFGTANLAGARGHVVSLKVSADYRAGRAQVMEGEGGGAARAARAAKPWARSTWCCAKLEGRRSRMPRSSNFLSTTKKTVATMSSSRTIPGVRPRIGKPSAVLTSAHVPHRAHLLPGVILLIAIGGCVEASIERAAAAITVEAIEAHVRFLSSDELAGRGAGTDGARIAARYVANQFELSGLEPRGDEGSYFQTVPILGTRTTSELSFRAAGGARFDPVAGEDYVIATGMSRDSAAADAELVFVGYGISAPELDWDDYKGLDLTGRVLVLLANDPGEAGSAAFRGDTLTYYGRWISKTDEAAQRGASAVLIIHSDGSVGYGWDVIRLSAGRERLTLAEASSGKQMIVAWLSEAAARQVLSMAGLDFATLLEAARSAEFRPVFTGVNATVAVRNRVRPIDGENVIGLIRGDADRSDEALVVTAHYDGLGIGEPVNGDSIYNGAYDNASGTALLLVLAEALARQPRRAARSILFVALTGGEAGLIGSSYYVSHPAIPLDRTLANINIDGANLWGRTQDVGAIGAHLSSLSDHVSAAAEAEGLRLDGDPAPELGRVFESDHYSFMRAGVPATYITHGIDFVGRMPGWGQALRKRYDSEHRFRPSDEYQHVLDHGGAVQQARFALRVILSIAEAPTRPEWSDTAGFVVPTATR